MMGKADRRVFDRLMGEARARMDAAPGAWGCTVLQTARGNVYSAVYAEEAECVGREELLLERLAQAGDAEVAYLLTLPLAVPSWRMRKLLPLLDPRNEETRVLFPEEGGARSRTLRECFPPKKEPAADPFPSAAFAALYAKAQELAASDPAAWQVVAVRSGKGVDYTAVVSPWGADETLTSQLIEAGDTTITEAVCMHPDGALNIPPYGIRRRLMELDPRNAKALFLLEGPDRFVACDYMELGGGKTAN